MWPCDSLASGPHKGVIVDGPALTIADGNAYPVFPEGTEVGVVLGTNRNPEATGPIPFSSQFSRKITISAELLPAFFKTRLRAYCNPMNCSWSISHDSVLLYLRAYHSFNFRISSSLE
ncbi:hypothetical protein ANCCAN_12347 [Ancylostoma caninum]|uniref:Uncharacterized protein n=1 Tax=Ancylostoma caninum TaxID=29170 RepID=A0A368GDB9_ANCCA|nr:hypothetical protein ANCCAN_12347 [Ancylostoma caninum]